MVITAVLVARLLLAGVFVVSGIAKLRDREGSRKAVQDFGVPGPLVAPVAGGLPYIELACAVLLFFADPAATVGILLAVLMLLAFTVAIVVSLLRGNRVDCHCFGQIGAASIGWPTVARNVALLVVAGVALVGAGGLGSVPAVLADYSGPELTVGVGTALLVGAVAALALVVRTLMGRYGAVLLRLEALEQATGTAPARLAPAFALPDLDGEVVDLDEVLSQGRPVLVAFISPSCSLCEELLPDFAQWQQDPERALEVLVLSTGSAADNVRKLGGHEIRLLLDDGAVAKEYDMQGTPAAYLLGADGLIAGPTAYGVDAVRALHDRTVQTVTGAPHVHQIGPPPVTVGDVLPTLDITLEGGGPTTIAAVTADEAVLVFWRTTCGYCTAIVDQIADLETGTRVLLVTGTPLDELRATGLSSQVLRESDAAVSLALQVPGTPSAVRVRAGMVQSDLVVGGPAVLALLRESAAVPAPS